MFTPKRFGTVAVPGFLVTKTVYQKCLRNVTNITIGMGIVKKLDNHAVEMIKNWRYYRAK